MTELPKIAIFDGQPLFDEPLHVNQPNAGNRDLFNGFLDASWETHWFTNNGPISQRLERELEEHLQVKNCVLASSGTSALSMTACALELSDEVIIPSFTFISTPHALKWAGIRPVFCDIDPLTATIDVDHCIDLITSDTTAIIGTHVWGVPCDIDRLERVCADAGIHLLFDAAHAFGCTFDGKPIARYGRAEIFSFHATKVFHTFEGGAVTTNDDQLAAQLRKIRNFGFNDVGDVEMLGMNAKMSEIHAAMGLANLAAIDETIAISKKCYNAYREQLVGIAGIELRSPDSRELSNYHYVVAEISAEKFGLSRDKLMRILHAENILARDYFHPGCHNMEPYRTESVKEGICMPATDNLGQNVLIFPGGTGVSSDQIKQIGDYLRIVQLNAELISTMVDKIEPFELHVESP